MTENESKSSIVSIKNKYPYYKDRSKTVKLSTSWLDLEYP